MGPDLLDEPIAATHPALAWAHPLVAEWFTTKFGTPTEPQIAGWPAILAGKPMLISAPTGSGKTLTAFLVCIDKLLRAALDGSLDAHTHVVYVSPLKALSNDVQKNLDAPLAEISELARARGYLLPQIRTGVRTGDTTQAERTAMLRTPPHILVTTPESLYILLTAAKPRERLRCVSTVIVDEIHAVADDKRGSHLALTLERLDALVCGRNTLCPGAMPAGRSTPPQRIGLSATQNPIELVAGFLAGNSDTARQAVIVQVGQRRMLDLGIEVPSDELGSLTTLAMWEEIYDKLALLAEQHRSTLVFVNTRRLVEKISFELAQRLGPDAVAAHHGSLNRALRLDAEQRLKAGEIRILIATASLELGIDIGNVDLVCQIASTRNIAVAMQRVGRAGHWRGAVPKGRLFATTRDDLVEQAALVRRMRAGELDRLAVPDAPLDVLMQQIVAMCGAEPWHEHELYDVVRRAWPYRELTRAGFDEALTLLHEGIESTRGRYGAYVLRNSVAGHVQGRRGARMIAISNGGAIPDTSLFSVMLQPENVQIATLDEHFAVDSSPGDIVLLGNTSWRIQRIDPQGKVLVEDAHGAPPSIPFWEGEAPGRTDVLSEAVGQLRAAISERTPDVPPQNVHAAEPQVVACIDWLREHCCVCSSGALQMVAYIVGGRAALGAVPTKTTIIAERFFDEGGGQQLILHAPFGARLNKAWGLALRKRFCRGFNFELQAAATDNGINISLAEQHSFPLEDVFQFLSTNTARELLEQASIPSPLFKNRWRWAAGRSLQLLRMQKGKRVAPQVQRTRSDDLLASVFPHASACPETMTGDIVIPDHPLVREVMRDTLTEAMDIDGLHALLAGIADGSITCLAVDTPVPSLFAHELIHAMPYAYLDEADAEARRARATTLRKTLPDQVIAGAGRLDAAAIASVRRQIFPDLRDEHEMHDLLLQLVAVPCAWLQSLDEEAARATVHWPHFLALLEQAGRAWCIDLQGNGVSAWVATERLAEAAVLWPACAELQRLVARGVHTAQAVRELALSGTEYRAEQVLGPRDAACTRLVQGWLQVLGPVTPASLGGLLALEPAAVSQSLLAMELQGLALRGVYEHPRPAEDDPDAVEWCERLILQRIHRLTLAGLRRQVEPVGQAVFMQWMLTWQHVAPGTQLAGEEGVLAAIEQLEGFEAPAAEWERTLLPARVAAYSPAWLDALCLAGIVGWGRLSPHPAWSSSDNGAPRRVIPTNAAPITFFLRESEVWLQSVLSAKGVDEARLTQSLSADAQCVRGLLRERGAAFTADLQRASGLPKLAVATALWELATAGLASADGFDQLRAMMDPRRKSLAVEQTPATSLRKRAAARTTAGRWSLLGDRTLPGERTVPAAEAHSLRGALRGAEAQAAAIAAAKRAEESLDAQARLLLCRYGVLFRELLAREANAPRWRDLAPILRRLEARGEVRGGRFVTGPFGEQFAHPEAAESLRAFRRSHTEATANEPVRVAATDPLNLVGIVVPGERVAAVPGAFVSFRNGAVEQADTAEASLPTTPPARPKHVRSVADMLRGEARPSASKPPAETLPMNGSYGLFG